MKAKEVVAAVVTTVRDLGTMGLGFWGIYVQERGPASEVNELVLLIYVSMIGGPALLNLLSLRSGSSAAQHTAASSSSSPVEAPSLPQQSQSPSAQGGSS